MLTDREFEQISVVLESRKKVTVGECLEILKLWKEDRPTTLTFPPTRFPLNGTGTVTYPLTSSSISQTSGQ